MVPVLQMQVGILQHGYPDEEQDFDVCISEFSPKTGVIGHKYFYS